MENKKTSRDLREHLTQFATEYPIKNDPRIQVQLQALGLFSEFLTRPWKQTMYKQNKEQTDLKILTETFQSCIVKVNQVKGEPLCITSLTEDAFGGTFERREPLFSVDELIIGDPDHDILFHPFSTGNLEFQHLEFSRQSGAHINMEPSTWRLLLLYRWLKNVGLCIGCEEPVKREGVLCSFCLLFRYCSRECLEKDRPTHKPACDVVRFVKGDENVIPDYVMRRVTQLMNRAKLLDSDGNFLSPSVMHDVYLVKSSGSFSRVVANLVTGSRNDTVSSSGSTGVSESEYGSISEIEYKNDSRSTSDSRPKNDTRCTNDSRVKNHTESKTDSGSKNDSGSKSDSGLKNDAGYKTASGCKSDSGSKSNSINVTFSFKLKDNNSTQPTNVSEVFQQSPSFEAEGGYLRGHFSRPANRKMNETADTKHHQATMGSYSDRLLKDNLANQKQSVDSESSVSDDLETSTGSRYYSVEKNQSRVVEKSRAVDRHPDSDSHLNSDSSHSSNSQSSSRNIPGSEGNQTNIPESFGSGWWGKTNKGCSRESTQGNKSSKVLNSNKNHQMENEQKQNTPHHKVSGPAEVKILDCMQTRERSESQTFGSGWWQGNVSSRSARTNSVTTKHEVKQDSQTGHSSNEDRQCAQSNHQKTSNENELSNGASKTSALNSRMLHNSDSSKTTSNNCVLGRNSTTNSSRANTAAAGNAAAKSSSDRKEPESDNFGAGWWKHQTKRNNTGKENSTKSTTDKGPPKVGKPTFTEEQKKQSDARCNHVNKCTDVSPFKVYLTPEHVLRFAKVASRIASSVIQVEATHGRVLVMGLISVPGLWRASLGGSRISLVVEIVLRLPSQMPEVVVHDKLGHVAPVLFNTSESTIYTIPGILLSLPISECLKPGTFVLLRDVHWEQLINGSLIIVMRDMRNVDFIFSELLD